MTNQHATVQYGAAVERAPQREAARLLAQEPAVANSTAGGGGAVLAVPAFWIIIKDDDLDLLIGEGLLVLCVIAYGAGLPSCERAHPRLATFIHETFIQTC